MAQTSYPLPPNRIVTDAEYEKLTRALVPGGVAGHPADSTVVYGDGSGLLVRVRTGKLAYVRGFAWESGSVEFTKAVGANSSGSTRTDLVVLRLTRATWAVSIEVRAGTPGAGAPAPVRDLGSTGVYELPIAQVAVASGASSVSVSNVTRVCWYIGPDGQTLCTSATRPPHSPGLVIWDTDAERLSISTGSSWRVVVDDSGISAVQIASGYAAAVNRLQRRSGVVVCALDVRRPGSIIPAATQAKIGALPSGFAPTFDVYGLLSYPSGTGQTVVLKVTTAGDVFVVTPEGLGVNPDRNLVGTVTWFAA